MAVARITDTFDLDNTGRFVVIFGSAGFTQEVFISNDLKPCSKEEILHKYLKEQGFQLILFFDVRNRIYCYDEETFRLSKVGTATEGTLSNKRNKPSSGVNGRPLGSGRKIFSSRAKKPNKKKGGFTVSRTGRGFYQIPFSSSNRLGVDELDSFIRDNNTKTALLIKFSELAMGADAYTSFLNTINGWGSIDVKNENKCFFIFNSPTDRSLENAVSGIPLIESIVNIHEKEGTGMQSILFLSYPKVDEIKRILQYYRLQKDLVVSWQELDVITKWLERDVQALWYWSKKLSLIEKVDKNAIKKILSKTASTDDRRAIDRLNELIGLSRVKQEVKEQINILRLGKTNPKMVGENRLHLTFEGNPGTGKTTVARIIAGIYQEEGVLERGHLVEADRASLVAEHVGGTAQKTGELCKRAMGGVLFIDEAYALKLNDEDTFGEEAISTLIKYMEDFKDKLCVIMAGYPEDMEELLSVNPGLKSRIRNRITFEDFTPDELFQIFNLEKRRRGLKVSSSFEKSLKQILENLYLQRDKEFGNAREVRNIVEGAIAKFATRCSEEKISFDSAEIIKEDIPKRWRVLAIEDDLQGALAKACEELNNMVGLSSVKSLIQDIIISIEADAKRRSLGIGSGESKHNFHLTFQGNPGTGKTTVARLLGKIFKVLGVVSRGHVIETQRADLVAGYQGQTAPNVKSKISEAMDGILFIDEAYALSKGKRDDFGQEAIETLLKEMEDKQDRLVVIAAGYPQDMEKFIQQNPGLRSRFTHHIIFEDYTIEELTEIFYRTAKSEGFILESGVEDLIKKVLTTMKRNSNKSEFGNAREVRKLFGEVKLNLDKRLRKMEDPTEEDARTITVEDIPDRWQVMDVEDNLQGALAKACEELNNMVGLSSVKSLIQDIVASIEADIKRSRLGGDSRESKYNFHLTFQGNPGTGKTTVARLLGKIFKVLGVVSKGHVIETQRVDLVAGYQGQTALNVKRKISEAMDGILFIDEAYALSKGKNDTFGQEAIETLLKEMEDKQDRLVVIAAGYPQDMEKFIQQNPGLRSRFTHHIIFEDYTIEELTEIFSRTVKSKGFILASGVEDLIKKVLTTIKRNSNKSEFGNAREVRKLFREVKLNLDKRFKEMKDPTGEDSRTITVEDIPKEYLKE